MRQKFGQNFLIDNNIANNIIFAAKLNQDDTVLEIGAGKGILTKTIAEKVSHLTAVEIDSALCAILSADFERENLQNINLINADFLKATDAFFKNLAAQKGSFKIISNLPYNIGTAIIQKVLPLPFWSEAYFMLQKEAAQRITAKSASKEFGYISLFCSYYAEVKILFDISPRCFRPQPKVTSSLIKLINKKPPKADALLFDLIKRCFNMRRKTILNSLAGFKDIEKERARQILNAAGIKEDLRPDKIDLEYWIKLTGALNNFI